MPGSEELERLEKNIDNLEEADFTGMVCAGSLGRIGLVVRKKLITFPSGDERWMWEGIGLDGKGLWAAAKPIPIQPSIEAYMDRLAKALAMPGSMYPPLGSGSMVPWYPGQEYPIEEESPTEK